MIGEDHLQSGVAQWECQHQVGEVPSCPLSLEPSGWAWSDQWAGSAPSGQRHLWWPLFSPQSIHYLVLLKYYCNSNVMTWLLGSTMVEDGPLEKGMANLRLQAQEREF